MPLSSRSTNRACAKGRTVGRRPRRCAVCGSLRAGRGPGIDLDVPAELSGSWAQRRRQVHDHQDPVHAAARPPGTARSPAMTSCRRDQVRRHRPRLPGADGRRLPPAEQNLRFHAESTACRADAERLATSWSWWAGRPAARGLHALRRHEAAARDRPRPGALAGCCSSTSPRSASTRRRGPRLGLSRARQRRRHRSSSPRTTWTRPSLRPRRHRRPRPDRGLDGPPRP